MNKQELLNKWEYAWKNGYALWSCQAGLNFEIIRDNEPQEAIEILKKDLDKYADMGIAVYIIEAIRDLESLEVGECQIKNTI